MAGFGYPQTHPGYVKGMARGFKIALSTIITILKSSNACSFCRSTSVLSPEHRLFRLHWQWSQEKTISLANTTGLLPRRKLPSQTIKIDPFQSSRRLRILPEWLLLRLARREASILRFTRTTPIVPSIALRNHPPKKMEEITKTSIALGLCLPIPSALKRNSLRKARAIEFASPLVSASVNPSP